MTDTAPSTVVGTTIGCQPIGTVEHLGPALVEIGDSTRHARAADAAVHTVIDEAP